MLKFLAMPVRHPQLWGALVLVFSASGWALGETDAASTEESMSLRGRVECVKAASWEDPGQDPCNRPGAGFALVTSGGERLRLLANDPRVEMFTDPIVRQRELELVGWRRQGDAFEILSVYSLHQGRRHHVHYRCEVCNITATAPGPCWCCGKDFELREEPVGEEPSGGADVDSN